MLDINDEKLKKGYVKLYRALINWEWFTDVNVCHLFIYCLLKANHADNNWKGLTIQRGSFITSLEHLSKETGLTKQKIRTALNKLELTGEITRNFAENNEKLTQLLTTCKKLPFTLITINNYSLYQESNTNNNNQITFEQQQTIMKNNNILNNNNNNNKLENLKKITDPFYSPEVRRFLDTFKKECKKPTALSPDERLKLVNILNDLILSGGFSLDEIIKTVCKNFNNLNFDKEKINVGINWLLKDSNFYGVLNGQNTKTNEKSTNETNNAQVADYTLGKTETYKGETGWTL